MYSQQVFDAIKILRKNGIHGWSFNFCGDYEIKHLIDYLRNDAGYVTDYDKSFLIENIVVLLADCHYTLAYGYRSLKIEIHCTKKDVFDLYCQIANLSGIANECLIYGYGYGWRNSIFLHNIESVNNIESTGLYFQTNWV